MRKPVDLTCIFSTGSCRKCGTYGGLKSGLCVGCWIISTEKGGNDGK